jgi:hypothetical protein
MEETQRSQGGGAVSGVTPLEEECLRPMAASDESIRGLGETQQAEMAMGDKGTAPTSGHEQTGGPKYPAGTGGHYPSSPDASMGRASSGESSTSGVRFGEGPTEQPREQMVQAAEPKA